MVPAGDSDNSSSCTGNTADRARSPQPPRPAGPNLSIDKKRCPAQLRGDTEYNYTTYYTIAAVLLCCPVWCQVQLCPDTLKHSVGMKANAPTVPTYVHGQSGTTFCHVLYGDVNAYGTCAAGMELLCCTAVICCPISVLCVEALFECALGNVGTRDPPRKTPYFEPLASPQGRDNGSARQSLNRK